MRIITPPMQRSRAMIWLLLAGGLCFGTSLAQPFDANDPPEPLTVPAVVAVPSPQLMVATRSEAAVTVSVSVKFATVTLLSAWLVLLLSATPVPDSTSCSPTTTLPLGAICALSEVRLMVTLTASVASSA